MSSPTPKRWTRIADDVRAAITAGTLAAGQRLESGPEFMRRYGVARQTVQAAMDALQAEGLIITIPGGARYVAGRRDIVRLSRTRLSRTEREAGRGTFMSDAAGRFTPDVATTVSREVAGDRMARLLAVPADSEVIVRARVMRADGAGVQLATSRFPASIAAGTAIERANTGPGGVYARLEDAGHTLTRFVEEVGARTATGAEVAALGLSYGAPVLDVLRIAYADVVPVEVNDIVIVADRYRLVYELPAD